MIQLCIQRNMLTWKRNWFKIKPLTPTATAFTIKQNQWHTHIDSIDFLTCPYSWTWGKGHRKRCMWLRCGCRWWCLWWSFYSVRLLHSRKGYLALQEDNAHIHTVNVSELVCLNVWEWTSVLHQAPDFSTASLSDTKRRVALPSPCWLKARILISYTKEGSGEREREKKFGTLKQISMAKWFFKILNELCLVVKKTTG